jgi:hypothetical protein
MTFDHLDDPDAPTLDSTTYDAMLGAARDRRHKRHLVQAAASGTVVAIAFAAIAVIATRPDDSHSAVVATNAPTTTTTLDPSLWVTTELRVDQTSVPSGGDVTGTVVFVNHTNHAVTVTDRNGCLLPWTVAVGSGSTKPTPAFTDECATPQVAHPTRKYLDFPPGRTEIPFRAPTRASYCAQQSIDPGFIHCEPNGQPPALPVGPAQAWFVTGGHVSYVQIPDPVAITITAGSDAKLVVPSVAGMHEAHALSVLRETGFPRACITRQVGADHGVVQEETPGGGSVVSRGTTIDLVITDAVAAPRTCQSVSP